MIFGRSRRRAAAPEPPRRAEPAPEMYAGTTILPEEGAAARIDSAADVDPNYKTYGKIGLPGGAGGYAGAGT